MTSLQSLFFNFLYNIEMLIPKGCILRHIRGCDVWFFWVWLIINERPVFFPIYLKRDFTTCEFCYLHCFFKYTNSPFLEAQSFLLFVLDDVHFQVNFLIWFVNWFCKFNLMNQSYHIRQIRQIQRFELIKQIRQI